jgi:hypothetical protein
MFYYDQIDSFERHCIGTQYRFAWLPKRCYLSNKIIWFTCGYKQTAMYTGPGDPVFECRWYDKMYFIVDRLRK